MNAKEMVAAFQCPGCGVGNNPSACRSYEPVPGFGGSTHCAGHAPATTFFPGGKICLGLPKGFNKVGGTPEGQHHNVRLWPEGHPDWNHLNIPVWAMEEDDFLFVRTFAPRLNIGSVDVIHGGKLADLCPQAIDVQKFLGEID